MPQKARTLEVYRLTISGLPEGISYNQLFKKIIKIIPEDQKYFIINSKHYSLAKCKVNKEDDSLELQFTSYKEGNRPDVLNTETNTIQDNPLPLNLESIEYTHALGCPKKDRYLLILERNSQGIWPNTVAKLIELICKKYSMYLFEKRLREEIIVNLEPVPGSSFQEKVKKLKRITKATLRIVKPNPCWDDLENELGDLSDKSNARMIEVTTSAPRGKSLKKKDGLVHYILDLLAKKQLDRAVIEGRTEDKTKEKYTTTEESVKEQVSISLDDKGQVNSNEIYNEMGILKTMEWLD